MADDDWKARRRATLEEFAVRSHALSRRARIDAAAADALEAFKRVGIDALLLKGAALAHTLYRPDEARAYFDADLLVAPSAVAGAGDVLRGLGYASLNELLGVEEIAGSIRAETWGRSSPGFGNITIDLHWRLDGCDAPAEDAWQTLWSRRAFIRVADKPAATLDRPGLALHLALHATQHGPGDLKALGDLRRGIERWPRQDWSEAAQLAVELGAVEAFTRGLRLVSPGARLADELRLPAAASVRFASGDSGVRPRGAFHLQAFSSSPNLRLRVHVLRRALFPRRAWIEWEYRWASKGRARLIAAYAQHLLRAPAWAIRAWRFGRRTERALR